VKIEKETIPDMKEANAVLSVRAVCSLEWSMDWI